MKYFGNFGFLIMLSLSAIQVSAEKISIEQMIRDVCTSSDSVKMMRENLVKSKQVIREKYSAALPKVTSVLSAGRMFPDPTAAMKGVAPDNVPVYSASAEITQPIYTFGKVGTAVEVAREYDNSMRSVFNRAVQDLQLQGLDIYYRVILSEMDLQVKKRSYARKKELSEFLRRNFELGSGSNAHVLSAEADLKSSLPELIKAEQNVRTAKMMFCMVTGRQLNDLIEVDTATLTSFLSDFKKPSKDEALKMAQQNRADLKAMEHLANANLGGAKIFKAMNYPNIAATAKFGTNLMSLNKEDLDWDDRNWTVGIGLSWNIFDGFENRAKSEQYRSDARKLELATKAFYKMIELEIDTALAEIDAADSNMVASVEMLNAAKEAYELTDDLFKQGSGEFVELQQAEERLSMAEMGIMFSRYRLKRSRAALVVAMGLDIIKVEE